MTNTLKIIGAGIAGIVVGWIIFAAVHGTPLFGGVYNQTSNHFGQGLYGGLSDQFAVASDGSVTLGSANDTTCNLSQSSAGSHAASSSKEYVCAVSGVVAGDNVRVSLPKGAGLPASGAGSLYGGFAVLTAYATTSGYVGVLIDNWTGAATTSFPQATTSVKITVFH